MQPPPPLRSGKGKRGSLAKGIETGVLLTFIVAVGVFALALVALGMFGMFGHLLAD